MSYLLSSCETSPGTYISSITSSFTHMSFLEQQKLHAISSLNEICTYLHAEGELCSGESCPVRRVTQEINDIRGVQIKVNNRLDRIMLTV